MSRLLVGTMGYGYDDWNGPFYPARAKTGMDRLAWYARSFEVVELDTTFYATPRPTVVKRWEAATPEGFLFTVKAPQEITHGRRLVGAQDVLELFLQTMSLLGDKLGPILFQFGPDFSVQERPALEEFLDNLPEGFRWAVEFRHQSWFTVETAPMLAQRNICWASADYPPYPKQIVPTSDFLYLRLIGRHGEFAMHKEQQKDRSQEMSWWLETLRERLSERIDEAYILFNNDYSGYSPGSANDFKRMLGQAITEPPVAEQPSLFD